MAVLSDTLLKEFAKATNDSEKEVKTESYVYGTAHVNNGTIQVQFDGSDLLTPCSATVEVRDGDRVMVMIKSRSAVITSNITRPSIHYTIGGLDISEDAIKWNGKFANKDYEVGLYKNQGAITDKFIAMNVGGDYVTYIRYDGYLYSKNAYIEGELHANRGEFTGDVSFAGGYVGGLRISPTSIYWEDTIQGVKYTAGLYKGTNSATDQFWSVKKGTTDIAYLRHDGYLYAENAYIKGTIHASNGEINGSLKITGGTIGGLKVDGTSVSWTNQIEGTNYKAGIYKGTALTSYFLDVNAGGNHRTYLRYDGYFYAENATIQGKITATEGAIGGFNIGTTSITWTNKVSGVNYVCGLYKGTNSTSDKFLRITKAGSDVAYMTYAGKLYAMDVEVKGKINTQSGSSIGGMATDTDKIGWASGTTWGYIRKYATSSTKFIDVQVSGTPQTYLTYSGKFYSQNAEIVGDITATTITALDHYYLQRTVTVTAGGSGSGGSETSTGSNYDIVHGGSNGTSGVTTYTTTKKLEALGYYNENSRSVLHVGSEFDVIHIGQPEWDYEMHTSSSISVGGIMTIIHQAESNCFTAYGCATFRGDRVDIKGDLSVDGSYPGSSDIRLKENVKDTEVEALPIVNAIRMRQFDWKEDHSHQSIGMVADEIELLDKRLTKGGGYFESGQIHIKKIDVWHLTNYLTKAIQELSKKVSDLERRLENG